MEARFLVAALALFALAGCVDPEQIQQESADAAAIAVPPDCHALVPHDSNDVDVGWSESNNPGSYSYAGQAFGRTTRHEVRWTNPSPTSRVAWAGQTATGDMHVSVFDACGKKLYEEGNGWGQGGGSRRLPPGHPGEWLIRLDFQAYTGQMSLSVTS